MQAHIAFVLARRPDPKGLTTAELIDYVAYASLPTEIVDSRTSSWDIGIVDAVDDNASACLFALGAVPMPLTELDLLSFGILEMNGELVSRSSVSWQSASFARVASRKNDSMRSLI